MVEVSRAGALGVLAATAYKPEELDAQLTWIEERIDGRPYGVDLLIPAKLAKGDPNDLIASLRAQIPEEHIRFVEALMEKYGIPRRSTEGPEGGEYVPAVNTDPGIVSQLLDVAFSHRISLIASALGTPPPYLVERGKRSGVTVAALVGKRTHAERQLAAGVDLLIAQGTEACGSVWLSSEEDIAPAAIKQKFLAATSSDTLRSATRTGKPARQLRSAWHDEWEQADAPKPLPMPLQALLVKPAWDRIDEAAEAGNERAIELESYYVGQVVCSFAHLRPAADIARELVEECHARVVELGKLATTR